MSDFKGRVSTLTTARLTASSLIPPRESRLSGSILLHDARRLIPPSDDKMTPRHLIVWDLETIPDLAAAARIHSTEEANEEQAREVLGDKFPKLPLHKIVCIGALIAEWQDHSWQVRSLGAPHIGERSEDRIDRIVRRKNRRTSTTARHLQREQFRSSSSSIPSNGQSSERAGLACSGLLPALYGRRHRSV